MGKYGTEVRPRQTRSSRPAENRGAVRPVETAGEVRWRAGALARNNRGPTRRRAGVARRRRGRDVDRAIRWFGAATAPPIGTTDERQDGQDGQHGQGQTIAEHGTP